MTTCGWKVGTVGGYGHKGEGVSELELTHYRLTKREEKVPAPGSGQGVTSASPRSAKRP